MAFGSIICSFIVMVGSLDLCPLPFVRDTERMQAVLRYYGLENELAEAGGKSLRLVEASSFILNDKNYARVFARGSQRKYRSEDGEELSFSLKIEDSLHDELIYQALSIVNGSALCYEPVERLVKSIKVRKEDEYLIVDVGYKASAIKRNFKVTVYSHEKHNHGALAKAIFEASVVN